MTRSLGFFAAAILTAALLARPGAAQEQEQHKPPRVEGGGAAELPPEALVMPNADLYPQPVLSSEFVDGQSKPFNDESLSYQITIRKDWKWEAVSVRGKGEEADFTAIGLVLGPVADGVPVLLQVGYRIVPREVSPEDYMEVYTEQTGFKIVKDQWGKYSGQSAYDVLARGSISGIDTVARFSLSHDGNRFFLVSGYCPLSAYPKFAKDIGVAIVSFHLLKPTGKPTVEDMVTHDVPDPAVSFTYPKSWTLTPGTNAPKGIAAFDLYNGDEKTGTIGWIRVKIAARSLYPDATANQYVNSFLEEVAASGFAFDNAVFNAPIDPGTKFLPGGRYIIFPVFKDNVVSEARLVVLPSKNAWHVLSLLSPARDRGMVEWMINKRAFEILHNSLEPKDTP